MEAKNKLSGAARASLKALLPGGSEEDGPDDGADGDGGCARQTAGGKCLAELSAVGADVTFVSKNGTATFETAECGRTDVCTLIQAVKMMLASFD